jgi:hypothetical protein
LSFFFLIRIRIFFFSGDAVHEDRTGFWKLSSKEDRNRIVIYSPDPNNFDWNSWRYFYDFKQKLNSKL